MVFSETALAGANFTVAAVAEGKVSVRFIYNSLMKVFLASRKNLFLWRKIKKERNMETAVKTRKRQHPEIKSITLFYNEKNNVAINTINYLLALGVFEKPKAVKSPLELALEDVKHGRITRIKNIDNFKEECLK